MKQLSWLFGWLRGEKIVIVITIMRAETIQQREKRLKLLKQKQTRIERSGDKSRTKATP